MKTAISGPSMGRSDQHTKVDESALWLAQLAHRLGADARLPRVTQLKSELGVSLTTLNSALKVLEERDVIYRRNGRGIFVSPSVQPTVSLICNPSLLRSGDPGAFWDILFEAARARADSHNELFEMHFSQPHSSLSRPLPQGLMRELREKRVSGVIGVGLSGEASEWLEAQDVPFVHLFGPGRHRVQLDAGEFVAQSLAVLTEQGCRRIGLWYSLSPHRVHSTDEDQGAAYVVAFEKELERAELEFSPARVQCCHELLTPPDHCRISSEMQQGRLLARRTFSQPRSQWPDGLILSADQLTRGVLAEMGLMGVQAGRDVQIASHANRDSPTLAGFESRLHLIEIDSQDVVDAVFDMLETLMRGEEAPALREVAPQRPIAAPTATPIAMPIAAPTAAQIATPIAAPEVNP